MRAPRSVQSCTALAIVFRSAADFGDRLRLTVSLRRVELERTFLRAHSPELPVVETKEELVRVDASDEPRLFAKLSSFAGPSGDEDWQPIAWRGIGQPKFAH